MRALTASLARFVIGVAALLVPASSRERWRREWLAELAYQSSSAARRPALTLKRALLALPDALDARFRRRSTLADSSRPSLIEGLRQDLSYAARALAKAPGFTLLATLTIALGIGATTAIFSLVNGILLQPLPYDEPERLAAIWPEYWFSAAMFAEVEERLQAYEAIAGYTPGEHNLIGPDGAERIYGPRVTAGFFDVLGRDLLLGRTFAPGDDRPGEAVTVVGHAFWRDRLAADPRAIGSTVRLGSRSYTVIGVLRPDFDLLQADAALAVPYPIDPERADYTSQDLKLIGRMRADVGPDAALPELRTYIDALRERWGANDAFGREATIRSLQEFLVGDTRPTLLLLFAAVGLTLLIATANVAGLLLTRAIGRRRELAVRVALGARRSRLVRQMLTESTLLALLGAIPGLLLARFALGALLGMLPADTPRLQEVGLDARATVFSIAVAVLAGWLIGVLPALQASGADPQSALGESARGGSEDRKRRRLRSAVVLGELALAVTLVVGAGVLVKSLARLQAVDPGFRADGLITFRVEPVGGTFASPVESELWFASLRAELARLPGVAAVSEVWKAPFNEDGGINGIRRTDVAPDPEADPLLVRWRPIESSYFETAGIRLVAGRGFGPDDDGTTAPVAVVSESTARELFGDSDPLGKEVTTSVEREPAQRIVGVVADLRLGGLEGPASPVIYRPYAQLHEVLARYRFYGRWMTLRLEGPPTPDLAASVRGIVRAHDPTALLADFTTLRGAIDRSISGRRVTTTLMTAFALTALLLGAVGIYGVVAYAVRQRWREIGIRVALGATRGAILWGVLRHALTLALLASGLGLAVAAGLARLISGFVFEVDPLDPSVLAAAVAVAATVAVLAALGPAYEAARSDPARTLTADG